MTVITLNGEIISLLFIYLFSQSHLYFSLNHRHIFTSVLKKKKPSAQYVYLLYIADTLDTI